MRYIFGPVNSRRLGLSLGVDIVPSKTCSMNCVYCECGATTCFTDEISEYIPTAEIITELRSFLSGKPRLDAITFSGSGEPTLHSGIGDILQFLKDNYPEYRTVVITNGSLLWKSEVRRSILKADIIIPSLDAVSEDIFRKINRPAPGLSAERIVKGLIELRKEFRGDIFLEVFIVPDVNDGESEIIAIRDACLKIKPDKIQLNTLDRPGTEDNIRHADINDLRRIAELMKPLSVEIIGQPAAVKSDAMSHGIIDSILSLLSRRPSTFEDISGSLNIEPNALRKIISHLIMSNKIEESRQGRGIFYKLKKNQ